MIVAFFHYLKIHLPSSGRRAGGKGGGGGMIDSANFFFPDLWQQN